MIEDVAVEAPSGDVLATRLKSGLGINPIADRSPELWKTFRNWIEAIKSGGRRAIYLTTGSGHAYEDLLSQFKQALIDEDVAEDVLLRGLGWVKTRIDTCIERGIPVLSTPLWSRGGPTPPYARQDNISAVSSP